MNEAFEDDDKSTGMAGAIDKITWLERRAQSIKDLSSEFGDIEVPLAVLPLDSHVVELEQYLDKPLRVKAQPRLQTAASFAEYVAHFEREGKSRVFVNIADRENANRLAGVVSATGIIDAHEAQGIHDAAPDWCDHKASYVFEYAPEWRTWIEHNDKQMPQVEFAHFLEENAIDVVKPEHDADAPDGATISEVAMNLELKRNVDFSSATRLQSGDHALLYKEETTAGVRDKQIQMPGYFWIRVPVFDGGQAYFIKAWFRHRLRGSELTLSYKLHRANDARRMAIVDVIAYFRANMKSPVFEGRV